MLAMALAPEGGRLLWSERPDPQLGPGNCSSVSAYAAFAGPICVLGAGDLCGRGPLPASQWLSRMK